VPQPGDANAFANPKPFNIGSDHIDPTDYFMAGDDRNLWIGQLGASLPETH
jgi:hypothetical protein